MLIWAVLSAEVDCLCLVKADGANRRTLMFLGHWSLPLTSLAAVVASCQIGGDKYGFQSAEIVVLWEDNFILKTAGLNFVILGDSYPTQISISHQLRVSKRRHAVLTSRDWNHCSGSSITLEKSLRATIWSILNPSIRPFSIPTLSCTQGVIGVIWSLFQLRQGEDIDLGQVTSLLQTHIDRLFAVSHPWDQFRVSNLSLFGL